MPRIGLFHTLIYSKHSVSPSVLSADPYSQHVSSKLMPICLKYCTFSQRYLMSVSVLDVEMKSHKMWQAVKRKDTGHLRTLGGAMTAQKYCICLDKETIECHIILVCVQRFQWQLFLENNVSVAELTTGVRLYKINIFYLVLKKQL